MIKYKKTTYHKWMYGWVTTKDHNSSITDLIGKLTEYLNDNPKYKLVSYNIVHDSTNCATHYYKMAITAILSEK